VLESDQLSSVFGIDIDMGEASSEDVSAPVRRGRQTKRTKKNTDNRSTAVKKPGAKKSPVKKKATAKKTTKKKKKAAKKKARKKKGTTTKKAGAHRSSRP
jgi:hypothetical protein